MRGATSTSVSVSAASAVLVGGNNRRHSLTLSVPSGIRVTISEDSPAVLDGAGLTLSNLTAPYKITFD